MHNAVRLGDSVTLSEMLAADNGASINTLDCNGLTASMTYTIWETGTRISDILFRYGGQDTHMNWRKLQAFQLANSFEESQNWTMEERDVTIALEKHINWEQEENEREEERERETGDTEATWRYLHDRKMAGDLGEHDCSEDDYGFDSDEEYELLCKLR